MSQIRPGFFFINDVDIVQLFKYVKNSEYRRIYFNLEPVTAVPYRAGLGSSGGQQGVA